MARIPDAAEFHKSWGKLDVADRRRVVRAVNRGQTLDSKREAALAVVLARRQQRFWRYAWILGPVMSIAVSLVFDLGEGWLQIGANALLGFAVLSGLSWYYLRRARIAEADNHLRATGKPLSG